MLRAAQRNDDFPDCLACGSMRTREHHFRQQWCRGTKSWTAESLCLDCHCFSWRSYTCALRVVRHTPRQAFL